MKWNENRSLLLSRFCVGLFSILLLGLCIGAPYIFPKYFYSDSNYYCISMWAVALPAMVVLYALHKLLKNIANDAVFIAKNITYLRCISWCCIGAGIIFLASSLYDTSFLFLSAAAAFVGLILRVLKNVFSQAILIKTENDYTI